MGRPITLTVDIQIDVETEREAGKLLDLWLQSAEDDDRLMSYEVRWIGTV